MPAVESGSDIHKKTLNKECEFCPF